MSSVPSPELFRLYDLLCMMPSHARVFSWTMYVSYERRELGRRFGGRRGCRRGNSEISPLNCPTGYKTLTSSGSSHWKCVFDRCEQSPSN